MEFFAAPSSDDARLRAAHESRGGDSIEIDALGEAPAEHPWAQGQDGSSRVFRFKAATIEALPATIPEREEGVVRSILVQRATEGRSHLVEVKAARGETGP